MSFDEVRFPDRVAYGATGGPMFNTSIVSMFGGAEQRNQNWSTSRGQWDVSTGIKKKTDFDEVLSFFRARRGKARGFRFKDWSDYSVTNQLIDTGDGSDLSFQLIKTYTSGDQTYTRTITKPVQGTVSITVNGIAQDEGSGGDYTIDYSTGIVTFHSASTPGMSEGITASFEFDVPVRFDIDLLQARVSNPGQFVCDAISLVELRV